MKLNYQIVGSGQALVILHGLFGSLDNWRGLAKQLSDHAQVITVDLRNHGRSPHSPNTTYQLMSDDLLELLDDLALDNVDIIGHSVGGKIAMTFSQHHPEKVRQLLVVDIVPRQYDDEHSALFNTLLALDLSSFTKRNDVNEALKHTVPSQAVRQFLLMNLDLKEQQLMWRINLPALFTHYPHLLEPVCQGSVITLPTCFVRGGKSDYIQDNDYTLIKTIFPQSEIYTIEHAGHWVHVDAIQEFLAKVTEFFDYDYS